MKHVLNFLLIILVIGMILLSTSDMFALGTASGINITNRASVGGVNFNTLTNFTFSTVRLIIGGQWGSSPDETTANAGSYYSNISYLSNLGNGTINFKIGVDNFNTNALAQCGGNWGWRIYTNANTAAPAYLIGTNTRLAPNISIPMASGAIRTIIFKVLVGASAGSGAYESWRLYAVTNGTAVMNTNIYMGSNSIQYGGPTTYGYGQTRAKALVWHGSTGSVGNDFQWGIAVQAPAISISKRILAISDVSGTGLGISIPGAVITYAITISNAPAGGVANNLIVKDYLNKNYLTFIAGSMIASNMYTNAASFEPNWVMTSDTNVNPGVLKWSNNNGYAGGTKSVLRFRATIK